MRGSFFCYFHARAQRPAIPARPREARIEIPDVLDAKALPIALGRIMQALAAGHLSASRAGKLIYGLQMAAGALSSPVVDPAGAAEPCDDPDFSGCPDIPPELEAEFDAIVAKISAHTSREQPQCLSGQTMEK
jgi:hypothetical protein